MPSMNRVELRRSLNADLRTDADLDAFCLVHFPDVFHRFSQGMERTQKLNLLMQVHDDSVISHALKLYYLEPAHRPHAPSEKRWRRVLITIGVVAILGAAIGGALMWQARKTAADFPLSQLTAPRPAISTSAASTPAPKVTPQKQVAIGSDNEIEAAAGSTVRLGADEVEPTASPASVVRIGSGNRITAGANSHIELGLHKQRAQSKAAGPAKE